MHCRILAIVYKRYIDYIFVIFNSYLQLLKFVGYMNHQHPNIKFTFEVEKNNNFPFLDIKICRENNQLTTSVFRKPTFFGVFINFDSFLHVSYKHSLVNTLIFRYFKMYFSNEKLHNEIVYHKEVFRYNRYPNNFVDLCIEIFYDKLYITKKFYQMVKKKQLLIILPFLDHLSF